MWAAGALLLLAASCRARLHGPDATTAGLSPAVRQLLQHEEHVRAELVAERDQALSALHAAEGAGKAAQNEVASLQRQVEAEGSMLQEMKEELKADQEVKADMDHFQTDSKSQEKAQVANKAMALSKRLYSALKDAKSKLAARDAELKEEHARLGKEAAKRKSEDLEMEAQVKELHVLQAESATQKVTTEELIKKLRANESADKHQLAEAQAKLSATAKELAASKAKLASAETSKQEISRANTKAAAKERELGRARAAADKQVEELRRLRAKASQGEKQLQESRAEAAKQAEELRRARGRAEAEERELKEARATVARQAEDLKTSPGKASSGPKLTRASANGGQKASKVKGSGKQQKQAGDGQQKLKAVQAHAGGQQELESAKKQAAKAKWKEELRQAHERTLARARELQAAQAELAEQDLAATEGAASGLSAASAELEASADDVQGVEAGSKDGALEELDGAVKATDREIKISAAVDAELQSHHDAQAALANQAVPTTAAASAAAMEPAAPAAKAVEGAAEATAEVIAEEPGKAKAGPKTTSVDDLTLLAFAGGAADAGAGADVVELDTDPLPPPDASEALAP
mmetsp:Transcript_53974/g.157551  ORF Transcript_53974/g.157551 Transcript_53974/m.157551 type:complete len:584 (+) Transcript_53974:60-1811(+)